MKPRTAPCGSKPHTAPVHNHAIMSEAEQAKYLSLPNERVTNLGHPSREDDLTRHPLGRMMNYDSADTSRTFRDPAKLQGVYGKCSDPRSGISSGENLDKWADYATKDSYHRGPGPGKDPTMPDPRGRHSNESDGYLRSTKGWADFEYGSESGFGRIEKTHRK
jgi:hypothetical protein